MRAVDQVPVERRSCSCRCWVAVRLGHGYGCQPGDSYAPRQSQPRTEASREQIRTRQGGQTGRHIIRRANGCATVHIRNSRTFCVERSMSWRACSNICLRVLHRISLVLLAALIFNPHIQAQLAGSLRGAVTDPSGAVIPGAQVTLTDIQTNRSQATTSNAEGIYTFNGLAPAPYRLTVTHPGFQSKTLNQVEIIPEQANQLNVQMQVGQTEQTVTVTSTTHGLPTETATLSANITSNDIQHMPSFNRDVFQLTQLTPGVIGDAAQSSGGGSFNMPGNQGPGGTAASSAGIFQTENG